MMNLAMNFDTDECLVTAMFDKGNRNDTMEAIDNIIPFLKGDVCLLSVFLITSTFVLQIAFMDILIQFILPMNVTCCICFRLLCSKGDDYVSSTLFSCLIWIAVWTLVVLKDSIYEHISTSIWCGMMILSVLYLCYSIWRVWKCSERYYESNGASV